MEEEVGAVAEVAAAAGKAAVAGKVRLDFSILLQQKTMLNVFCWMNCNIFIEKQIIFRLIIRLGGGGSSTPTKIIKIIEDPGNAINLQKCAQ